MRTFDPAKVAISIGGANINGFADGTFVSIARDEQTWNKVVGSDGTVSRAKSNNRSGTLTLTLQQTSPSNDILSGFLNADEAGRGGVFAVQVKDVSGGTKVFSGTGWIQGMPVIEYSNEISNVEWIVEMAEIEFDIAGNPRTEVSS